MPSFNIASIIAKRDWSDLGKVIRDIYRRLDQLATARTLENAFIGRGGITIGDDGSVVVQDAAGNLIAEIGKLTGGGPDDSGMRLLRTDAGVVGTLAFRFRGGSVALVDASGNVVLADDITSRMGLAVPFVGGGCFMADTNVSRRPQTTNASFTEIAAGWYLVENPRLQWDIETVADVGVTGQVRLLVNGTQVGTTQTVTGSFTDWYDHNVALPAGVTHNSIVRISMEARVTSGAGSVYAVTQRLQGDQSP